MNDEGLKEAYEYANKNTWSKEELEAYDYAAMREQDERGRIAMAELKAEQKGVERREIEAVIGLEKIGLQKEKIAEALSISTEKVMQILENHKNSY